jgi:hypothetical protein
MIADAHTSTPDCALRCVLLPMLRMLVDDEPKLLTARAGSHHGHEAGRESVYAGVVRGCVRPAAVQAACRRVCAGAEAGGAAHIHAQARTCACAGARRSHPVPQLSPQVLAAARAQAQVPANPPLPPHAPRRTRARLLHLVHQRRMFGLERSVLRVQLRCLPRRRVVHQRR